MSNPVSVGSGLAPLVVRATDEVPVTHSNNSPVPRPGSPPKNQRPPREEFKHQYQRACLNKMKEAMYRVLDKDPENSGVKSFQSYLESNFDKENGPAKKFAKKVKAFSEKVHNPPAEYKSKYIEDLRRELVELSKDEYYVTKKNGHHPAVNYLQLCAMKLESVDGTEMAKEYGEAMLKKHLPSGRDSFSFKEFIGAVDGARAEKASKSNRDSVGSTLAFFVTHPRRGLHVSTANKDPLGYQSYDGNPVFLGPELKLDDKVLHHKHGPGITGEKDSLVENFLIPANRKLGTRMIHINNQNGHLKGDSKGEPVRVAHVHAWAATNPDVFTHVLISFDTPAESGKAIIQKFKDNKISFETFYDDYVSHLRDGIRELRSPDQCHGIVIPEDVLNDEELESVFDAAKIITLHSDMKHNPEFPDTPEGREKMVNAVNRNIAQKLEWAIMKKELSKGAVNTQNDPDLKYSTFGMACKENIDRAVQEHAGAVNSLA